MGRSDIKKNTQVVVQKHTSPFIIRFSIFSTSLGIRHLYLYSVFFTISCSIKIRHRTSRLIIFYINAEYHNIFVRMILLTTERLCIAMVTLKLPVILIDLI